MANHKNTPAITEKFHIEVPLNEYYSGYCVYKAWFGTKYFIGKGKALLQSVQGMAVVIERGLRLRNHDETNMHYHVIAHIIKNSLSRGRVEVIGGEDLSEFELLKLEQEEINRHINDPNCLNNNFDAYVPKWISEIEAQKFLQWKGISKDDLNQRAKVRKKDDLFYIEYFAPEDKDKRGVYKLHFGEGRYYIGRAKILYNRTLSHQREIKKRLAGFTKMGEKDLYLKVIKFISKNKIKSAVCELLKECVTVDELIREEQRYLDIAKADKLCLNMGFVSKRTPNEIDDTVEEARKNTPIVVFKNGKRHFISRKKKANKK
jgi:hypothetical protein